MLGRARRWVVLVAADLAAIRRFYLSNFWAFSKDILGYEDIRNVPHFEVCEFIANSPGNGSWRTSNIAGMKLKPSGKARVPDKKRRLLLLPRNTFKSTLNSKAYPIWLLLQDPKRKILIISNNDQNAKMVMKEIMFKFNRPEIKAIFGDYLKKDKSVIRNAFHCQLWDPFEDKPVEFQTMPNIKCCGTGTNVTGLHCDYAIVDDIITPENTTTEQAREAAITFMRHLEPVVNPGGNICVIGTRYHFDDLYGWIMADDNYDIMLRSAINEDDTLYFQERLSREYIASQFRIMGSYVASGQYYNNPINPVDQVFKEHWIQACIRDFHIPDVEKLTRVMYIDPAMSTGTRSDYTAMVVAGMNKRGDIFVLDCIREKLLDDELIERAYWLAGKWNPEVVGVEVNAAQKLYLKIFQLEGEKREKFLPVRAVEHTTRRDKDFRIRGLMPFVERGQIHISPGMDALLTEMRRYVVGSTEHDDQLDALEGAVYLLKPPEFKEAVSLEAAKQIEAHNEMHDLNYKPIRDRMSFRDTFNNIFN